jgi:hypothetical protein
MFLGSAVSREVVAAGENIFSPTTTTESASFFVQLRLADRTVRAPVWYLGQEVHGQPPFGRLEVLGGGRRNDALGFRHCFLQSPGRIALVGFILATNPFGVFVAGTDFAKRTKMAFGCALEEGIKDKGSDSHGWNILPDLSLRT